MLRNHLPPSLAVTAVVKGPWESVMVISTSPGRLTCCSPCSHNLEVSELPFQLSV